MRNKKVILSWVLVGFLMLIIFIFSNQDGNLSSNTSIGFTKNIYLFFHIDKILVFESFHGLVRKIAHFFIYLLLGLLIYNALFETYGHKKSYIALLLLAIFITFIYSGSDEIHQLFIRGRSGEFRDVLIDTSGGSIGCLLYYFYLKIGCVKYDLQKR